MPDFRKRRANFLQAWQILVAEMTFSGANDNEIAMKIWDIDKEDKRALENAKQRLRRLRRDERFQDFYRNMITDWSMRNVGRALNSISKQLDDSNPWIVNKAANDVITNSKVLINGTADDTVVVKVEGMPEIGSPDSE